jgi:PAS domain S-box-containing protein
MATAPAIGTNDTTDAASLNTWREEVLNFMAWTGFLFALPILVSDVITAIMLQEPWRIVFDVSIVSVMGLAAIGKPLGVTIRTWLLIAPNFVTSTVFLLTSGLAGTGRLYVVLVLVEAVLLLRLPGMLAVWLATLGMTTFIYWGFAANLLPLPLAFLDRLYTPATLTTQWLAHLFVGAIIGVAILLTINRLQRSLRAAEAARAETQRLNTELEQRVAARTAELRQSEARLQAIFDNAAVGISLVDTQGHFRQVNRRVADLLGYAPDELAQRTVWEVTHPEHVPGEQVRAQALLRGEVSGYRLEKRYVRQDGRVFWADLSVSAIHEHEDGITHVIGIMTDITERKEAEEAYHTLVNHSVQALVIFQDGRNRFVNPATARITGYAADELLAMTPEEANQIVYPEDRALLAERARLRQQGADVPPHYEFRLIRKDGAVRWIECFNTRIIYHGQPAVQMTYIDITERKEAEAQQQRQADVQAALARCSHTLIRPALTPEAQQEVLSAALEHLRQGAQAHRAYLFRNVDDPDLGFCSGIVAEAYLPGFGPYLHHPPSQRIPWSQVPEENRRLLEQGEPCGGPVAELFATTPELTAAIEQPTIPIQSVQFFPVHFGGHWWGYIGFDDCEQARSWDAHDIALLRVGAELIGQALQRWELKAALVEREARLRTIWESATDAMAIMDPAGTILLANPAYARLYGYPLEQVIGQPFTHTFPEDQRAPLLEAYRQSYHAPAPTQPSEATVYHVDGSTRTVEAYVSFLEQNGQRTAMLAIVHDITERKHNEATLRQQAEALAMLRERERLARELHDNLGQVLGYVATQTQAVQDVLAQDNVAHARALLTALLDATQEGQTDMRAFIRSTRTEAHTEGERTSQSVVAGLEQQTLWFTQVYGISVTLHTADIPAGTLLSPLVEAHLLRIVQEALTNIRKHAQATQVQVQLALAGADLTVTITDDGCGFDPAQIDTNTSSSDPGTRYGLESMRSRAAEMGGHVEIASAPGQGTTVTVTVPMHPATSATIEQGRVLLVDDSPLFVNGLHSLLSAHGYTVVGVAHDGDQAIDLAHRLRPDLILMDVKMPTLDGLEATRRITAEWPDTQVVMLTVSDDDDYLFSALQAGAAGYLLKSLGATDLLHRLYGLTQGEAPLSPGLAVRVLRAFAEQAAANTAADALAVLNPTQREVLTLVAEGSTYREVGRRLGFSEDTIKKYMGRIVRLLQVQNRAEAVAYLRRHRDSNGG